MSYTTQSEQNGQSVQLFTNPSFGTIRTAGTADNPLFCLADICKILDLDPSAVSRRLSDGVISSHPIPDSLGRIQQTKLITEPGLYKVIFQSRKQEAEAFTDWVTSEVLPSIRKNGGYLHVSADESEDVIISRALVLAHAKIEESKQRIQMLEGENERLMEQNVRMAPKAQYVDEVLQSTNTSTFTEVAKELNFRNVNLFTKRLLEDRIVFRQSGRYLPCAKYSGLGLFASRTHKFYRSDGRPDSSVMTVITEKGRAFLHRHFNTQN